MVVFKKRKLCCEGCIKLNSKRDLDIRCGKLATGYNIFQSVDYCDNGLFALRVPNSES